MPMSTPDPRPTLTAIPQQGSTHHEATVTQPTPTREVPATAKPEAQAPDDCVLDHGVEESFPASDPVSVSITKIE